MMKVEEKNFKQEENMRKTRLGTMVIGILFGLTLFLGISQAKIVSSLEGVVMDSKGVAVPGVVVIAKNTATQVTYRAKTDKKGLYTFENLPIGIYDVWVMVPGFQTVKQTGVNVRGGKTAVANFTLHFEGNMVSPTKAALSSGTYTAICPFVCPGVWKSLKVWSPTRRVIFWLKQMFGEFTTKFFSTGIKAIPSGSSFSTTSTL